ncbi:hypothetical protein PR048_013987 [Dryococelus australis]|uniref:Uncharacterized protein n=1 Tax=Dryococelus australis TaxID=614101 RepID=A0ABQ9HUM9_9NEOP|nr:hypothetical protein PR048_013987 [Dryococelus australis]
MCLKNSLLLPSFKQLHLRTNMCFDKGQDEFQQFLRHIGEETCPPIPCQPEGYIELPDFLVLSKNADICNHVFGKRCSLRRYDIVWLCVYFPSALSVISTWAILCPWNGDIDDINVIMDQLEDTNKDSMNIPIEFYRVFFATTFLVPCWFFVYHAHTETLTLSMAC